MTTQRLLPTYKRMLDDNTSLGCDTQQAVPTTVHFSDCDVAKFTDLASRFGSETYAYVVTPNVDHLIRFWEDPSFRDLYRSAAYVLLDSRFLAYVLRLTAGKQLPTCPGSDVTAQLFDRVIAPDDKIVLIGGSEQQAQYLTDRYALRGLRHFNPPMGFIHDPAAVEECLRFIEKESPFRFCLLAVGCPQQELVARALQTRGLARGLALCIGASINFLTGVERRAPLWLRKLGFEWLYRLCHNPMRLAKRYLVRGPRIFFLLPRLKFELRSTVSGIPASPRS